ncbi:MAG: heat-inducible transcriptional repressor HrcA [Deltaproteobacteria bacterium]
MNLDERKKKILESIIKDYVETAEPVGSRAVVKKHDLKISPATVRNEMADLEEMGFLEQPHTSAGRIPSEQGFRYFVDWMMEKEHLSDTEMETFQKVLTENNQEWHEIAQSIGDFLAQTTSYTSFVIVPAITLSDFKYIQLVPVDANRALVLMVTEPGAIMHRKIEVPDQMSSDDFDQLSKSFTRALSGKKPGEIRRSDLSLLRDRLRQKKQIIDRVLDAIDSLLDNSTGEKVVVSGALNILNEPEFKDIEKIKRVLAILEEDDRLRHIIPDKISEDVDIRIGRENQADDIKEMSLVFAGYKTLGEMGKIGLIGPVRMEYWKAAGSVESVRTIVEDVIKRF